MGEWGNRRMRKWCFRLFEPAGVEGVVVGYSLNFAFDVGWRYVFYFFGGNSREY